MPTSGSPRAPGRAPYTVQYVPDRRTCTMPPSSEWATNCARKSAGSVVTTDVAASSNGERPRSTTNTGTRAATGGQGSASRACHTTSVSPHPAPILPRPTTSARILRAPSTTVTTSGRKSPDSPSSSAFVKSLQRRRRTSRSRQRSGANQFAPSAVGSTGQATVPDASTRPILTEASASGDGAAPTATSEDREHATSAARIRTRAATGGKTDMVRREATHWSRRT